MTLREAKRIVEKNGFKIIKENTELEHEERDVLAINDENNRRTGETSKLYNSLLDTLKDAIGYDEDDENPSDILWATNTGWGQVMGKEWSDEENTYLSPFEAGHEIPNLDHDLFLYNKDMTASIVKARYGKIFKRYGLTEIFNHAVNTILQNNKYIKEHQLSKEEKDKYFNVNTLFSNARKTRARKE
jgi:hypothetical protein